MNPLIHARSSGRKVSYSKGDVLEDSNGVKSDWTFICELTPRVYKSRVTRIFSVICKCGKLAEVMYTNIRTGKTRCCNTGSCRSQNYKTPKSPEASYNSLLYAYKKGATSRGFIFEITKTEFKELVSKNFYYCGLVPSQIYAIRNTKTGEVRAGIELVYNGLDRVDNSIGYTLLNTVPCCKQCNLSKRDYSETQFKEWISRVYNFQNLTK
jgi:hypothetical protein